MKASGGITLGLVELWGLQGLGSTWGALSPIPAGTEPFLEGNQCWARWDE